MFVAAALVPDTALLVPGAGGGADAGSVLRGAALEAVGQVAKDAIGQSGRVVVVAPGRRPRDVAGPVRASLGGAGVPDEALGWPPGGAGLPRVGVPASVGVLLLAQHGVRTAHVHEVVADQAVAQGTVPWLRALGGSLVERVPTALVVVGSASARHGPDAPLADDPRAPAYDDALLADLADAGPRARARLAALDPDLASALAVTGWAPWQVLLGAVRTAAVAGALLQRHVLAGATHAVLTWRNADLARGEW